MFKLFLKAKQRLLYTVTLCLFFLVSILLPAQTALSQTDLVLVIVPDSASIQIGESQSYRAYLSYDGGVTLSEEVTEECNWTIDDPNIATVGPVNGLYTGDTSGETTVRAYFYSEKLTRTPIRLTAEAKLAVHRRIPVQARIWLEVEPKSAVILVGDIQQYRAYLHRTDTAVVEDVTEQCNWVLFEDIATSIAKGRYLGDSVGSSPLKATYVGTPPGLTGIWEASNDASLHIRHKEIPPKETPPTKDLPKERILNRQPGYLVWSEPQYLADPGVQFTLSYDDSVTDGSPDRYPRVFYWNDNYEVWVALASYPLTQGVVQALNDGGYAGWFVVFGCIQPRFNDITPDLAWAEPTANRMNGLGLLDGYPNPDDHDSLVRPAGLGRTITRAELTFVVARILGLDPGETHLYPILVYFSDTENDVILEANYTDADQIPAWSKPFIAAMTEAGLVRGKQPEGNRFAPHDEMTRIEAAVLISDALRNVPGFDQPADLTIYTDADQIPAWAVGQVSQGTVSGYPDGTLRPNNPINRAEAMTLLLRLLRGLGW